MDTNPARSFDVTSNDILKVKSIAAILEAIDDNDPADAKQAIALFRAILADPKQAQPQG